MTTLAHDVATVIHDAIDRVATTAEEIHTAIADLPLERLGDVTHTESTVDEIRSAQRKSIGAIYALVRRINGDVRRLTCDG